MRSSSRSRDYHFADARASSAYKVTRYLCVTSRQSKKMKHFMIMVSSFLHSDIARATVRCDVRLYKRLRIYFEVKHESVVHLLTIGVLYVLAASKAATYLYIVMERPFSPL